MKKHLILIVIIILSVVSVYGQQSQYVRTDGTTTSSDPTVYQKNEIRLNLLESVLGLPEINYERFIEDNFGVGIAASTSLLNISESQLRSMFLVFGRLYLSNSKICSGFYIEGNTGPVFQRAINYYYTYDSNGYYSGTQYEKGDLYVGFGLGVATGYKFLTKNNWVGELSLGVGRVFGNNLIDAYPRVGITIGKRF